MSSADVTLSAPESYDFPAAENRFVFIEGDGEFSVIAPRMWEEFNSKIQPQLPNVAGARRWAAARGTGPGVGHYRCGVLLQAPLSAGTSLPSGAKLGSISAGKYARFVMKGTYTQFTQAYEKAFAAIKQHDTMKIRPDGECLEEYLDDGSTNLDMNAQHETVILLPVDVPSGKYTLQGPERRHMAATPNRYLHLSGHGASIEEINPGNLWMKFHGEIMPQVEELHKEGVTFWATACTNVKGKGTATYRCGALLSKAADKHVIPKHSHAHLSELPSGDYVMFEMTGWFDGLGQAYGEAIQRAKDAGFVVMEHEDFMETYLTDPMNTPYDHNRTEIYLPIEASSPTRKHRTEQPSG